MHCLLCLQKCDGPQCTMLQIVEKVDPLLQGEGVDSVEHRYTAGGRSVVI